MADNCEPRKIDSNNTGLSFAETICGRLPTIDDDGYLPTWYELEPNSYSDFGGEITTTARTPINASRQRKKGVTTDLNASGGFNQDYTKSNFNRLLQGILFADARERPTTAPLNGDLIVITGATSVGGNTYQAAGGLDIFSPGQLINVKGFATAANNGVKTVVSATDTTVTVSEAVTTEASPPAGVTIRVVGYQLPADAASITLVGNLAQLSIAGAAPAAATGTVTFADVPVADEIVSVGGVDYTFVSDIENPYDVLIGSTAAETASNFAASINGNVLGTPVNPYVTATVASDVVTLSALIPGTTGNSISLATDADDVTLSGAALSGGTGFSLRALGCIVGEWVNIDADNLNNRFVNNRGYARIASITDVAILFDKTTWVPSAESGTGKSLNVWLGTVYKNEKDPEDIVTRYYEFERTLGKDGDGIQTEYLTRAVANEFTLNIPLPEGEEAKLNADISFVAGDAEQRTGAEGRKPGPFVAALGEDAINTANNIVRMRMSVIDPANSRPAPLFAYIVEGNISINNNVTAVKAVGTLGNIDVNVGNFDVGGEVTAIFSTVLATRAVRNNADVTLDFIAAAGNAGFVYDIPLVSLGGGIVDIEAGREIRVPLTLNGAENPNEYTLLYVSWDYLPTAAMPVAGGDY